MSDETGPWPARDVAEFEIPPEGLEGFLVKGYGVQTSVSFIRLFPDTKIHADEHKFLPGRSFKLSAGKKRHTIIKVPDDVIV